MYEKYEQILSEFICKYRKGLTCILTHFFYNIWNVVKIINLPLTLYQKVIGKRDIVNIRTINQDTFKYLIPKSYLKDLSIYIV